MHICGCLDRPAHRLAQPPQLSPGANMKSWTRFGYEKNGNGGWKLSLEATEAGDEVYYV